MEVADSHMLEQSSALTPSLHPDIDMSGDYYDEEYIMHDAHPTTEPQFDDEEIYDAEIEDQTEHAEVEMDEYTDELADDNETNMGTYIPADDATVTDVTVEDAYFPSSPVASGTPIHQSPHPATVLTFSPHVGDANLLESEAAPVDPISTHSPHSAHSAVTLVDDSETDPAGDTGEQAEDAPYDVTEPTSGSDKNLDAANGEAVDATTGEGVPNDPESVQAELYDEDDLPTTTDSPAPHTPTVNAPQEEHDPPNAPEPNDSPKSLPVTLHDLEPLKQVDGLAQDVPKSPIEDALALNQQARDDAADTMEPSPPVRLTYDDTAKGVARIFDIFAPIDPSLSEATDILFDSNRTLFYDPLSVFFARLRETEYFARDDWYSATIEISVDLGNSQLYIAEDHKQTDEVSLFNLHFLWSGLGLEGPLHLMLHRRPGRFSVQYAQLIDYLEQKDVHNEVIEEPHEIERHGIHGSENGATHGYDEGEDEHAYDNEEEAPTSARPQDRSSPHESEPHGEAQGYEGDTAGPVAERVESADQASGLREQGDTKNEDKHSDSCEDTLPRENIQEQPQTGELGHDAGDDPSSNGDLYDDDEYAGENLDAGITSANSPEQQGRTAALSDEEYDESETSPALDADANGPAVEGPFEQHGESENYYDEYDETNEDIGWITPRLPTPNGKHETDSGVEAITPPLSPTRHPLKRNLDDLNYNDPKTADASLPTLPADTKRAKHA